MAQTKVALKYNVGLTKDAQSPQKHKERIQEHHCGARK